MQDTDYRRRIDVENKAIDVLEEKQLVAAEARAADWASTIAARRSEEETRRRRRKEEEAAALGRSALRATALKTLMPGAPSAREGDGTVFSTRSGASASFRSVSTASLRTPSTGSALRSTGARALCSGGV